jgi:hypothetical protein
MVMADRQLIRFGLGIFGIGFFLMIIPSASDLLMIYVKTNLASLQFIYGVCIVVGIATIVMGGMSRNKTS